MENQNAKNGLFLLRHGDSMASEGAVVLMVRVEVPGLAPGVSDVGEKEQVASAGKPEQENEMREFNDPPMGVAVTV